MLASFCARFARAKGGGGGMNHPEFYNKLNSIFLPFELFRQGVRRCNLFKAMPFGGTIMLPLTGLGVGFCFGATPLRGFAVAGNELDRGKRENRNPEFSMLENSG